MTHKRTLNLAAAITAVLMFLTVSGVSTRQAPTVNCREYQECRLVSNTATGFAAVALNGVRNVSG